MLYIQKIRRRYAIPLLGWTALNTILLCMAPARSLWKSWGVDYWAILGYWPLAWLPPFLTALCLFLHERRLKLTALKGGAVLCPDCRYDLQGSDGPCPECGSNWTQGAAIRYWNRFRPFPGKIRWS